MTTGAIRAAAIRSAAAMPSRTGIFTSRITRSGRSSLGQLDGLGPVAGLADDVVPLLGEHLREVHPDQRLVLGDHHGAYGARRSRGPRVCDAVTPKAIERGPARSFRDRPGKPMSAGEDCYAAVRSATAWATSARSTPPS